MSIQINLEQYSIKIIKLLTKCEPSTLNVSNRLNMNYPIKNCFDLCRLDLCPAHRSTAPHRTDRVSFN